MPVDEATVRRIAHLARIAVTDEEAAHLEGELNSILHWVEQLGQVDTAGVAPMTGAVEHSREMRADVVDDGGYPEQIVANAPESDENYFLVPKVVE
ncbi:MAG: Asp-tRNA(Asn)/Glu-tRNA(Gln) amidotransferase GatCAB subunit C [Hyphomicrobiales bacterium]|nr:MAG: Asp-tRNA(Asn)/Glu-tRNA(Gln) amidotransferase GatCAB subunit C [Hyphomicrobiales bacterium]